MSAGMIEPNTVYYFRIENVRTSEGRVKLLINK